MEKAAQQDHSDAQNYLGLMYQNGYSVEKDTQKAMAWYKKASDGGNIRAKQNLDALLPQAEITLQPLQKEAEKNQPQEDFAALYKAAAKGDAKAQNELGGLFAQGYKTEQDHEKALHWYKKAAQQGHASAFVNLGNAYLYGLGVPADRAQAMDFYMKAIQKGNPQALKACISLQCPF